MILKTVRSVCILALALSVLACGSRNLYRNADTRKAPFDRGFIYQTRIVDPDAGVEPVEYASTVVTADTVYVSSETKGLEAFSRSNFARKWVHSVKNGIGAEPVYVPSASNESSSSGTLFFGANDGAVYAVDADYGRLIWKFETKNPVYAKPTVVGGRVYVSSSDDTVYCLDQGTGKWVWHYKRSGNYVTTVRGNSSVAIADGKAYVGFSDGYLVSLGAKDGNLLWQTKIHTGSKFTDVDGTPVVDGARILVASYDGGLYSLDKASGKIQWKVDVGSTKKILLDKDSMYAASNDGNIYALNKESGRVLWKFELDNGTPTNIVQYGNYLVFGASQQYFYAIFKGDGSLAYRFNSGMRSGFVSTPYISQKEIFILSNYGNLYVFRDKNKAGS